MKLLSIVLLFICSSYASANECIAKSDVESLIMTFKNNGKQSLIDMAVDSVKPYIENDLLIKNKTSALVNISEIYYGWGVDRKSKYPVNTSAVFPIAKVCVWNVSFALPESMRKQCDDDGAYGYFIEFEKINGKTVLYSFTSLFDSLPNGALACKAANVFMLQK